MTLYNSPSHGSVKKVDDIIGRETEMAKFWKILEKKSLLISSVRRMGKTCILKKMCAQPPDGWVGVEYFVQGKSSPEEFVFDLEKILLEKGIAKKRFKKLRAWVNENITDKDFNSFKVPSFRGKWKGMLEKIVEGLVENDSKVAIMVDEFPLLLWNLICRGEDHARQAMELLDVMRSLRERYEAISDVRFLFCGSIGMNIVLQRLKLEYGYMGEPINNMARELVLEMSEEDAIEVCHHFHETNNIKNTRNVFQRIILLTDRMPFYIEMVFAFLEKKQNYDPAEKDIDEVITLILNDPTDNGEFAHFGDRISTYYLEDEKLTANQILNILSTKNESTSEKDIINELNSLNPVEELAVRDILQKLWIDLYLERKVENKTRYYKFRFGIIKKWWEINKSP